MEEETHMPFTATKDEDERDDDDEVLANETAEDLQVSVQRSGWLKKKGGGLSTFSRRNWKSRWFVLSERRLTYSEMVGTEPLGAINVEDIEAIEEVASKGAEFGFAIHTPKRTYWCVSSSEDDRKQWVLSLRKARAAFARPLDEGGKSDFMVY
eukprot:m.231169 g.231169  ORF g.231169 m.231169 type:complete len:153 (+) comp18267_c0_seq1:146-604(+)